MTTTEVEEFVNAIGFLISDLETTLMMRLEELEKYLLELRQHSAYVRYLENNKSEKHHRRQNRLKRDNTMEVLEKYGFK